MPFGDQIIKYNRIISLLITKNNYKIKFIQYRRSELTLFRRQAELYGVAITLVGELLTSIKLQLTDSINTRGCVLTYYLSSTHYNWGIHR